jgi:hypothetical protein
MRGIYDAIFQASAALVADVSGETIRPTFKGETQVEDMKL